MYFGKFKPVNGLSFVCSLISFKKSSKDNSLTSPVCLSRILRFSEFASFSPITRIYRIHSFSASRIRFPILSFLSSMSTRTELVEILSNNCSEKSLNSSFNGIILTCVGDNHNGN